MAPYFLGDPLLFLEAEQQPLSHREEEPSMLRLLSSVLDKEQLPEESFISESERV